MSVCSFCRKTFAFGGVMFVYKTGKILRFCSSKCEKNMLKFGKEPSGLKWITKKKK